MLPITSGILLVLLVLATTAEIYNNEVLTDTCAYPNIIDIVPTTNLLTGVYYRISIPNHPLSVLTWAETETKNKDTNFIQIDDHESRFPKYSKGGIWYRSGLWFLKPSEKAGYVTIHNGDIPTGLLAVNDSGDSPESEAPRGDYLILVKGATAASEYSASGAKRKHALWEIVPTGETDQYMLKNVYYNVYASTTVRYGNFYRWVKFGRADICHNHLQDTNLFKFKAITVNLNVNSKFWI